MTTCYQSLESIASPPSFDYLRPFIAIYLATCAFEWYINYRQLSRYTSTEIHPYLTDLIDKSTFTQSQAYNYEKHHFMMFQEYCETIISLVILYQGLYAIAWRSIDHQLANNELCQDTLLKQDMVHSFFFVCLQIFFSIVMSVPFAAYKTFVIEQKYGFNKTTVKTFILDRVKSTLLMVVISAILVPLLLWVVDIAGDQLVVSLAALSIGLIILLQILVPNVIMPMFNTFSDLEDGDLKRRVYQEAEKTNVAVSQVKVIDGSQRSSHSNAFVSGFWKFRKVVIYDTLIQQQSTDEIIAIVNHELGHVVHNHIVWNMVSSVIQVTIMFSVFKLCLGNEDILSSFGFSKPSNFVYLFLFSILYGPTNCVTKFIVMYMIRTMEYQADDFATYHGHAQQLKSGLTKIFVKSKGPLTADPLYSAYNHSHPTLMERLLNIDAKAKK